MGWENVFHCEWNDFGKKVLKYYWPKAISYDDITKTDFTIHRGKIDILTGGFPCQPYSSAGKRLGKEDERHLWPEMLRTIREVQPGWVVGENVLGLVNWSGGLVFHEVQADLEAEGYEVQPFVLLAVSVNAPHRRDRVWFVAYSKNNGWDGREFEQWQKVKTNKREFCKYKTKGRDEVWPEPKRYSQNGDAADTNSNGLNKCDSEYEINPGEGRVNALGDINKSNGDGDAADTNSRGLEGSIEVGWNSEHAFWADSINAQKRNFTDTSNIRQEYALEDGELERRRFRQSNKRNAWNSFPSVSPICIGDDGLSNRLDSITFPKWRNESIKAGGNAIVPQVVYQIFKTIEQYEREHNPRPH